MKSYILILLLYSFSSAQAQKLSLETILKNTEKSLAKIKNGYYEFEKKIHWLDGDITIDRGIFVFDRKLQAKKLVFENKDQKTILSYNPKQGFHGLTEQRTLGSSAETYRKDTVWYEPVAQLKYYTENTEFTSPLALKSKIFIVKQLPDTIFNQEPCYQIQYNFIDTKEAQNKFHKILITQNNFLPVQLETYLSDSVFQETQYTRFSILKKGFNHKKYTKEVTNIIIRETSDMAIKRQPKPEIQIGDTLPDFMFQNLPNYDINFANLTQDYILLDFWYISCAPCVLAAPFVDSLAIQYENKNLFVLGVNPYDTSEVKINEFKKKKNINYPNILIDIKTADLMSIIAYPTAIIIERKTRKVVYIQKGYGEEMKQPLIDFIEKQVVK